MIIKETYDCNRKEFKAKCILTTDMHTSDNIYNAFTFNKPDSYIYVEDSNGYSYLTYTSFFDFFKNFMMI